MAQKVKTRGGAHFKHPARTFTVFEIIKKKVL